MSNSGRSFRKWIGNCTVYSKKRMKVSFSLILLFFVSTAMSQSLRDSLYGGKLKVDTGAKHVSKDTGKYVAPKEIILPTAGEKKTVEMKPVDGSRPATNNANAAVEVAKPDENMPDSLNKLFYSKQRLWKRFIESNTTIITQQANDTRKVKKGEYQIEIEYEIGLNGRITTTGVTCAPQNEYLVEQFTELMKRAPVLSPPIYSDGKPRKMTAKQPVTVTKK